MEEEKVQEQATDSMTEQEAYNPKEDIAYLKDQMAQMSEMTKQIESLRSDILGTLTKMQFNPPAESPPDVPDPDVHIKSPAELMGLS